MGGAGRFIKSILVQRGDFTFHRGKYSVKCPANFDLQWLVLLAGRRLRAFAEELAVFFDRNQLVIV